MIPQLHVSRKELISALGQLKISVGKRRAEALRQSILKKAFSGQLVPQDPHDEPASALLVRIKADKSGAMNRAPTSRGGRETTKTKGMHI